MKRLSLIVLMLFQFIVGINAQVTEKDLAETYWKYRDRFRKSFISIGKLSGQSIPIEQIRYEYPVPVIPPQNINLTSDDIDKLINLKGRISFSGDEGMDIGYYLVMLATEYHLLKNEGGNLTGVKNEIYYALNAINRIDDAAENYFNNQINIDTTQRNGFFMREDVPVGFYERWEDIGDGIAMQGCRAQGRHGINQVEYHVFENGIDVRTEMRWKDRDSNLIFEGGPDAWRNNVRTPASRDYDNQNKWGNKWNEMSQDQVIGILLGLKYVSAFVDNIFIKPTNADEGFNLQDMSKTIAKRIIDFMHDRKEFCNSQIHSNCGTDESYVEDAIPTGNCNIDHVDARWIIRNPVTGKAAYRGPVSYPNGLGFGIAMVGRGMYGKDDYIYDDVWVTVDRKGNDPNVGMSYNLENNFSIFYNLNKSPAITTQFFNANHIIRIGTAGGSDVISHQALFDVADNWDYPWMELLYSVLWNKTPKVEKALYLGLLNKAPCEGPNLTSLERDSIFTLGLQKNNGGEQMNNYVNLLNRLSNRKGRYSEINILSISKSFDDIVNERIANPLSGADIHDGEFNGLDYMILYNLFRIKFGSTASYTQSICPCTSSRQFLNTDKTQIETIGTSYPKQTISTVFRFPEYKDLGIPIPEYLTHHFWIMDGGVLNVTGDLTIGCSSTEINNGGILKVLKSTSTSKQKYLTISKAGGLIVKEGGTLYVEDGNTVIIEEEGVLNVLSGSHIVLNGANAILEIRGKLVLGANAIFKIEGGALGRGYVKWNMAGITSGTEARSRMIFGANSRIELIGTGKTDKILEVNDHIFWPDNNYGAIAASVILKNGKIEMGKNAIMNIGTAIELNTVKIVPKAGASSFKGIILWGNKHTIYQTEIEGSRDGLKSFNMVGGYDFKATGLSINNSLNGLSIEGKGYQVAAYSANVIYTGGMQSGINATGIDRESRVSLANITNCTKGITHTGNIGGGLSVHNSAIGAYSYGIEFKSPASLLAQCNEISAIPLTATSFTIGITSTGGKSELAPSLGRNAGGNIFHDFSYSIFIDRNNLYLNEGNNNLSSFTNTPDRAVFGEAIGVPLSGTLNANLNIWDVNFNPPYSAPSPSANYNVWYKPVGGGPYSQLNYTYGSFITSIPQFMTGRVARCNNTYVGGAIGGLYPSDKNINTTSFVNTNIKNAFETTLGKMYNPVGMDFVIASANWNEILTCEWLLPLSFNDYYYVSLGIDKMMENVGLYLLNDSFEANSLTISNPVLASANSTLGFWINLTSTDTNYYTKQINQQATLANAQILHNANDFVTSKNLIDNLVLTASGTWKQQADYWQCQWLRENEIKMSDNNPDSIAMANWPNCYCGDNNSNALVIKTWEETILPQLQKQNKISRHLILYPNPATTSVTAELETSQKGTASIRISSLDGKCIKTLPDAKLHLGKNKLNIPVSDIAQGVYIITIETNTIKWNDKVIIK